MFRNRYVLSFLGITIGCLADAHNPLYRKNSQKPGDELIQRFQKTFSDVVPPVPNRHTASFGQIPAGPITPAKYLDPFPLAITKFVAVLSGN